MPTPDVPQATPPPLSADQRRRGQKLMIRTAVSNCLLKEAVKHHIAQVFLLSLGATPWQIGLQSTLRRMSPAAQLAGLKVIPRTGKSRMAAGGYLVVLLPLACLIMLAFKQGTIPPTVAISIGIAAYATMAYIGAFAQTSWWPLLQDVTAEEPKGMFFARMRTCLRAVEVLVPIAVSWFIATAAMPWRYAVPFALGAVATVAASVFMRRMPERPLVVRRSSLWLRMRLALRVRSVRAYLRLVGQSFFIEGMTMPFFVVLLRAWGLPDGHIVLMGAAGAIGHMAGLRLWGRSIDTHGGRPALSLSVISLALLGVAWLAVPTIPLGRTHLSAIWPLLTWSLGFYLLWGFFRGGFLMGRTHFLLDAIPHRFQADGFTLIRLAQATGGAAGAFIGGLAFDALTVHPVTLAGLDGRAVYLAAVQLAMLLVWPAKTRLTGHAEQTPGRKYLVNAWQLFRRQERF